MSIQYRKVQSAAKVILPHGPELSKKVLEALKTISDIVGSTLGPGGMPVLIERQEAGLPPLLTKDGVTVFRSLGFSDPVKQNVMEITRDAAQRTVEVAGDGTTTSTVIAEAIVRYANAYVKKNPTVPPQKIVRRLENLLYSVIEPSINERTISLDKLRKAIPDPVFSPEMTKKEKTELLKQTEEERQNACRSLMYSVAKVSANGDTDLAQKVLECFDLVGDEGNVTLVEFSGPSGYAVEKIEGFTIPMGFEESAAKFNAMFVNDASNQRCYLEKPHFILYNGLITDISTCHSFLAHVATLWQNDQLDESLRIGPNVILVATGFSESVLGSLAMNFIQPDTLNVVPLLVPKSIIINGEQAFLDDLAAVTGATVLNPLSLSFDRADHTKVLGRADIFEMYRFRSCVIGHADEDEVLDRVEQLQGMIKSAESKLDKQLLEERLAKITGGIAKLKVIGSSNGELKEKRDRAEDAVCAVRGAIKHGAVPGGGWMLLKLVDELSKIEDSIVHDILIPALREPVIRLLKNVGLTDTEVNEKISEIEDGIKSGSVRVFDALDSKMVNAIETGLLDSTPAVLEAIRSSVSIASNVGILGGVVAYPRDEEFERREASDTADFLRNANINPANERG